jgi:hypothetical protein
MGLDLCIVVKNHCVQISECSVKTAIAQKHQFVIFQYH